MQLFRARQLRWGPKDFTLLRLDQRLKIPINIGQVIFQAFHCKKILASHQWAAGLHINDQSPQGTNTIFSVYLATLGQATDGLKLHSPEVLVDGLMQGAVEMAIFLFRDPP